MALDYILSQELRRNLEKLAFRDNALAVAVGKKIRQIASLDDDALSHFKNLRGNLSRYKRVHVGNFVLFFCVEGELIVFDRLLHHDDAY